MRLHSCYFSMQNFETTVADQGAVGMLFKGPLLFWGNAIKVCIDYTRYLFVMSNSKQRFEALVYEQQTIKSSHPQFSQGNLKV